MAEYNPELVSAVSNILRDILGPDCTIDYYVDYREAGALNSAEDIEAVAKYLDEANGDVKLAANYAYYDTHMDAVSDIEMYLENDLVKQVEDALADYDSEHGTELLDELQAIGWDYDFYEPDRKTHCTGIVHTCIRSFAKIMERECGVRITGQE